jgi:hypothetical protein
MRSSYGVHEVNAYKGHRICPSFSMFYIQNCSMDSRVSSVGIATSYGLDDRGSGVRLPAEAGNFSLFHRVQTGSGAHLASCPMGIGVSFLESKAAGA